MFTNMSLHNFKSWRDSGNIPLAPITIFFGANSSGKSSLLQMLLLLKQTAESNDRNLPLKTGSLQEAYVNLGTVLDITHADTTALTLQIGWSLPMPLSLTNALTIEQLDFSTTIAANPLQTSQFYYVADGRLRAGMEKADGKTAYTVLVEINGEQPPRPQARPRTKMGQPQKCYGFSDEAMVYYQGTSFLADLALAFEQQFRRVYYLGPLREYPQRIYEWAGEQPFDVGLRGEKAVAALLAGKHQRVYKGKGNQPTLERRIAQWLAEMRLGHEFRTFQLVANGTQYQVKLTRDTGGHEVLLPDIGFGVSQVLPVLVLCYYAPEGSTVILEQPELHLHPAAQSALADMLVDVVKRRNLQLIIESHSEHLLRRLQRHIADGALARDDAALYFCQSNEGVSSLQPLEVDLFGHITNWPDDFFGDQTILEDQFAVAQASIKGRMSNVRP